MPKHIDTATDNGPVYASDTALAAHFGVNRATIWGWVNLNGFPKPVKLSPQCTRWRWADVQAWESSRPGAQAAA